MGNEQPKPQSRQEEPKRPEAPPSTSTSPHTASPSACPYPSSSSTQGSPHSSSSPYHSPSIWTASAPTVIKKFGKPTVDDCLTYRICLDFVVSNLKFSAIHHDAVTDGTMMNAWLEEKALLTEQLEILEKLPSNTPAYRRMKTQLEAALAENQRSIERNQDPNEKIRCRGMRDMHHDFVRTLESMIPLLKAECPDDLELQRKEPADMKY